MPACSLGFLHSYLHLENNCNSELCLLKSYFSFLLSMLLNCSSIISEIRTELLCEASHPAAGMCWSAFPVTPALCFGFLCFPWLSHAVLDILAVQSSPFSLQNRSGAQVLLTELCSQYPHLLQFLHNLQIPFPCAINLGSFWKAMNFLLFSFSKGCYPRKLKKLCTRKV